MTRFTAGKGVGKRERDLKRREALAKARAAKQPAPKSPKSKGKSKALDTPSTPKRAGRGRSPAPSEHRTPNTPNRARGEERDVPCLGCVKSCLAGKGDGKCYDNATGKGARCFKCSSGHPCVELPKHAKKVALKFMFSYQEDEHGVETVKLRKALRVLLAIPESDDEAEEGLEDDAEGAENDTEEGADDEGASSGNVMELDEDIAAAVDALKEQLYGVADALGALIQAGRS